MGCQIKTTRRRNRWLLPVRARAHRGFALVVALALMGFLLLLLVGLAALTAVETRRQQGELDMLAARANAALGLKLAIAQLQVSAGLDTRVTARADILTTDVEELVPGTRYWTGVWQTTPDPDDTSTTPPVWLVSGLLDDFDVLSDLPMATETVELVGLGSAAESVSVGLVDLPNEAGRIAPGRFAWWVGDEGVKAKVNLAPPARGENADNPYLLMAARRYGLENITDFDSLSGLLSGDDADLAVFSRLSTHSQLAFLGQPIEAVANERFFDVTTHSFGVLTNSRNGGLRRDLTARLNLDPALDSSPVLNETMWNLEVGPTVQFREGPRWNLVREFARLVELTNDPERDLDGIPVLPVQLGRVMGVPSYKSQQPYPVRAAVNPLIAFSGVTYGVFAREIDTGSTDHSAFRLYIAIKPVVVLWNPYDVAIESPEGYSVIYTSRNGGMHQFGPRLNMVNSSADVGRNMTTDVPELKTRNIAVAALLPGAPIAYRSGEPAPLPTVWSNEGESGGVGDEEPEQDAGEFTLRDFNLRFSIGPVTLLPGEIATFSLPTGTRSQYEFLSPTEDDSLYGVSSSRARGGPVLTRGFRPGAFVYVPIHEYPIGSTGYTAWEGSYADMGRVDFFSNPSDGVKEITVRQRRQQPGGAWNYRENVKVDTLNRPTVRLSLGHSSGGQFGAEFYKGRMVIWGDNNVRRVANENKLLQYFWSPHVATSGAAVWEFNSADQFRNVLVGGAGDVPRDFSSWAIVLATPEWERPRQLLAHHNPRATVHHNFHTTEKFMHTSTHGPIYFTAGPVTDGPLYSPSLFFPEDAVRHVTMSSEEGTITRSIGPVLFHVPRHELVSIGQLSHLELVRNCWMPAYAVGNSLASPWVPADQDAFEFEPSSYRSGVFRSTLFVDHSYHLNNVLWDSYFFSTWRPDEGVPLNRRLRPIRSNVLPQADDDAELFAARNLLIDGAFNVNSTSVEAWKALLSSLNNIEMQFLDRAVSGGESTGQSLESPFPRSSYQPMFGGIPSAGVLEFDSWRSVPELNPTQVEMLAERIVFEIRSRGRPFESLASFINREPRGAPVAGGSERDPRLRGILQRALDGSYQGSDNMLDGEQLQAGPVNPRGSGLDRFSSPAAGDYPLNSDAFGGLRAKAVPGFLMQSDLLQALGPVLSARSDTFVVRAYGDTLGHSFTAATDQPIARAWCEAVVQRLPDYVDPALNATDVPGDESISLLFGRQFRLISFRWLSADEI